MTIYAKPAAQKKKRTTVNYRKIYLKHHGFIPVDEQNRSYDIHHIDGNDENNDISNLLALSIQDHYDLHYAQGDYQACRLIKMQRLDHTAEELAELNSKAKKGKLTVKHAITGKVFGMMSITDERYLSREYVPVSTGLKHNLEEKNCRFCANLFKISNINRHEKTCEKNANRVTSSNNTGHSNCRYCNKLVGNTNLKNHESTCEHNSNRVVGHNHGKKYNTSQRECSHCHRMIGATRHSHHERCCSLNPINLPDFQDN